MTSVPSIMAMLMHPKTQNCIIYVRPDHTLMHHSCYSCLPWGFRSCAMWCCVAGLQFPAVLKELLFTLVSKYVFFSWIHLFLHFAAGCVKQSRSARCAKSPKCRWEDNIKQDICQMKMKNWVACIEDRGKWKEVVEKAKTFNH